MFLSQNVNDNIYRSHFDFHVFFIGYCLSEQIKKIKFETDGTFDSIYVEVGDFASNNNISNNAFTIGCTFDFEFYNNANEIERCKYYVSLLKRALLDASKVKHIPLNLLNDIIHSLVDNKFVYSWNFKTLLVNEFNLKIKLNCRLSTNDFLLNVVAYKGKSASSFCEGTIIRTKPDDIFFSHIAKKVRILNDKMVISSKWDTAFVYVKLKELQNGVVVVEWAKTPYPDDMNATNTFYRLQKELTYDNFDFI